MKQFPISNLAEVTLAVLAQQALNDAGGDRKSAEAALLEQLFERHARHAARRSPSGSTVRGSK
jgi:hypothetical protein